MAFICLSKWYQVPACCPSPLSVTESPEGASPLTLSQRVPGIGLISQQLITFLPCSCPSPVAQGVSEM